jgi:hypothetical protein
MQHAAVGPLGVEREKGKVALHDFVPSDDLR